MYGIVEGVAGHAIWGSIMAFCRRMTGRRIQITHPRPQAALTDPEGTGPWHHYPVRGTLGRLPANHEIWLLTEDEVTGRVWPQGFFRVQFDPHLKTWMGKINGTSGPQVKITAVLAPPTSQDFFRYFQKVGGLRGHEYEPLNRIPVECTNRASVQSRIP
jgi:hypothetical protein